MKIERNSMELVKGLKVGEIADIRFFSGDIVLTKTLRYEGGLNFYDANMYDGFGGIRELCENDIVHVFQFS